MLDWYFNEYESLPLLVTLLMDESVSESNDSLDELYNTDAEVLSASLWESRDNDVFLEKILNAIITKEIVSQEAYSKNKTNKKHFADLYLEPVSFFRWSENEGYEVPYNVLHCVRSREDDHRVANYAEHTISKAEVDSKLKEPLWLVPHAIMYLFGFEPPLEQGWTAFRDVAYRIVHAHEGMKAVNKFLDDAAEIRDIKLYSGSMLENKKVKPLEFMKWAAHLGMEFPNLIVPNEKKPKAVLHSKEKETLLKLLLGMALTNYEYDPFASRNSTAKEIAGDLGLHGVSIDEDTVRKWLNEAKEFLPIDWTPNK